MNTYVFRNRYHFHRIVMIDSNSEDNARYALNQDPDDNYDNKYNWVLESITETEEPLDEI